MPSPESKALATAFEALRDILALGDSYGLFDARIIAREALEKLGRDDLIREADANAR